MKRGARATLPRWLSQDWINLSSAGLSRITNPEPFSWTSCETMPNLAQRIDQFPTKTHVVHGPIWDTLSGLISDKEADLLVIGTHDRTGVQKLLMGSVAEEIFRQARCPVLTVGPNLAPRYTAEEEEIFPFCHTRTPQGPLCNRLRSEFTCSGAGRNLVCLRIPGAPDHAACNGRVRRSA